MQTINWLNNSTPGAASMTDLSPLGRAHLLKNAQIYGDEVLVDILDALEVALKERDMLLDFVNRSVTEPDPKPAPCVSD